MKRFTAEPLDTLRVVAENVKIALTDVPVTSGLTGSLEIYDAEDTLVDTVPMTLNIDDDWYVDIDAPATAGLYRMALVLTVGTAQRTLEAELRVV